MPLFSIVMPIYNSEKFLEGSIGSVLAQTFSDYELLLVDDGSQDSSGRIVDEYAANYPQITAFHIPDTGVTRARQTGIMAAKGKYIVFIDADDGLKPDALATLAHAAKEYSDPDVIIYNYERGSSLKQCVHTSPIEPKNPVLVTEPRALFKKFLSANLYNPVWRKAVKREILQDIDVEPFAHYKYGEDMLHSLQMLKRAARVLFIDNDLYAYVYNPRSATGSLTYETYKPDFSVREDVLKFLEEEQILEPKDMEDYRADCIKVVIKRIQAIEQFNTSMANKAKVFQAIQDTDYYKNFLNNGPYTRSRLGSKAFVFTMFQKKQFRQLLSILHTYRFLSGRNQEGV